MIPEEIQPRRWYYAGGMSRYVIKLSRRLQVTWPPWETIVHYVEKGPMCDATITLATEIPKQVSLERFALWAWDLGQAPPSKKTPSDFVLASLRPVGETRKVDEHDPKLRFLHSPLDPDPPRQVPLVKPKDSIFVRHLAAVAGHKEACQQVGKSLDIETFLIERLQKTAYLEHQVEELKSQVTRWAILLGWNPLTMQGILDWVNEKLPLVVKAYHVEGLVDSPDKSSNRVVNACHTKSSPDVPSKLLNRVVLMQGGKIPEDLQGALDHSTIVVCSHCGGGPVPTGLFTTSSDGSPQLEVSHRCKGGVFQGAATDWPDWVKEGASDEP